MPYSTIDAAALHDQLSSTNPPRLVDVRTPAEFETQHISGADNVPLDLLREHRDDIASHLDQRVVLICRSGQRAAQAEESLCKAGLRNVSILEGGISGWQAGGFAVNRGRQRWELERQVRLIAGMIVALSVLASTFIPYLEWVALAIGTGLTIAALTNTCAMGMLLARLPYNRAGATCDAATIVNQLLPAPQTRS